MMIMNSRNIIICAVFILIAALSSCGNRAGKNTRDTAKPADSGTIHSEIERKISGSVIGDIPLVGRLAEIKKRGILRVALPPEYPPFQSLDPALKLPLGFNPALSAEIARILEVKTNITILDKTPSLPSNPENWNDKYDMLFLPESVAGCQAKQSIPYFFTAGATGWKTICIADTDGNLTTAVREILVYLNETGIYSQLYRTYVAK
jgi:ABC-type amino acid transport substrate-binding protein